MDPMDYILWQEFIDPEMEYECRNCGTLFGSACVAWSDEDECVVYECPGCGLSGIIEG